MELVEAFKPNENRSFCDCFANEEVSEITKIRCVCGEENTKKEWEWDKQPNTGAVLVNENCQIHFHNVFSSGTAVVKGNTVFQQNCHYYWEIKILTKMYGTDVMIGVGTDNAQIHSASTYFCSFLGSNEDSYGYSYNGLIQHKGKFQEYGPEFAQGSIVGVHLDMCSGTLEYYNNRKPLGIAFTDLKQLNLYPMVCSTAAQSAVRLICAVSMPPNLQLSSLVSLMKTNLLTHSLNTFPGLKNLLEKKYWWILLKNTKDQSKENVCNLYDGIYNRKTKKCMNISPKSLIVYESDDDNIHMIKVKKTSDRKCTICLRCKTGKSTRRTNAHHFSCSICLEH